MTHDCLVCSLSYQACMHVPQALTPSVLVLAFCSLVLCFLLCRSVLFSVFALSGARRACLTISSKQMAAQSHGQQSNGCKTKWAAVKWLHNHMGSSQMAAQTHGQQSNGCKTKWAAVKWLHKHMGSSQMAAQPNGQQSNGCTTERAAVTWLRNKRCNKMQPLSPADQPALCTALLQSAHKGRSTI